MRLNDPLVARLLGKLDLGLGSVLIIFLFFVRHLGSETPVRLQEIQHYPSIDVP